MKIIFSLLLALCASTCYAHGGWKPCVQPVHPNVPYPYPQVVVPAQPPAGKDKERLGELVAHKASTLHEIGRASCRERV